MIDAQDYFLGGSVSPQHNGSFDYYPTRPLGGLDGLPSAYYTTQTGNFVPGSTFKCKLIKNIKIIQN